MSGMHYSPHRRIVSLVMCVLPATVFGPAWCVLLKLLAQLYAINARKVTSNSSNQQFSKANQGGQEKSVADMGRTAALPFLAQGAQVTPAYVYTISPAQPPPHRARSTGARQCGGGVQR